MSKQVQAQKFTLSGSGVSASATTIALTTLATPDGTAITMTDFGSDVGYATLEPNTAREESISFTGISSTSLTGVSRGLRFVSPFDVVAGNKKAHAGGTILVFSNTSAFYSRFVDDFNAQTIAGVKTFSSIPVLPASDPTTANQAARKAYVDLFVPLTYLDTDGTLAADSDTKVATQKAVKTYADALAIAGSPDASTTAKGIVEEATAAEVIAGTQTGDTGARLFINPGSVAETGADKIIKTKSTGLLDASIIPTTLGFGGGSDGDVTISSPTTLTRDMYYDDLTVNDTLTTNGYKIFVNGTLSGNGTIKWGVPNVGANASGTTAGVGGAANGSGGTFYLNAAGGAGTNSATNGSPGSSVTTALGSAGGQGGEGGGSGSGGAGGTVTAPTTKFGVFADLTLKGIDFVPATPGFGAIYKSSGGGGGGKGGYNSGAGGGGGAGGGIVWIWANIWAGTFTIHAAGADGGNGSTTFNGGGGGGGGGVTIVIYNTKTWTGSYNVAGGAAGTQSGGVGASAGTTGVSYEIAITSLTR